MRTILTILSLLLSHSVLSQPCPKTHGDFNLSAKYEFEHGAFMGDEVAFEVVISDIVLDEDGEPTQVGFYVPSGTIAAYCVKAGFPHHVEVLDAPVNSGVVSTFNAHAISHITFYTKESLLPVELVEFDHLVDGGRVILRWVTASETNNAGFEIQHKPLHESEWIAGGFVDGAGHSDRILRYEKAMPLPRGTHLVRLKQVDYDNSYEYSPEILVHIEHGETIRQNGAFIIAEEPASIYDVTGRRVHRIDAGKHTLPSHLGQGMYFARTESGGVAILIK